VECLEARDVLSGLVFVPSPQISSARLVAAAAISASDIWAVGSQPTSGPSQVPLAEQFDGTSWRVVSAPSPTSDSRFESVAAAASYDVWAVGVGGTNNATLIEHWNGTNWSEVSSPTMPTGSELQGVTAPASNNAWAVGTNSGSANALVEHWDGTSWTIAPSPNTNTKHPLQGSRLNGITAISSNDIWAVGSNEASTLTEHWDGTRWRVINSPNPGQVNSHSGVTAVSDGTVAAVGFQDDSSGNITPLILQDSGSAPKSNSSVAVPTRTTPAPLDAARAPTAVRATATQTSTMWAPLDAAAVDQFVIVAVTGDRPLLFARHRSRAHRATDIRSRDVFPGFDS
jgi:hypothetical protein